VKAEGFDKVIDRWKKYNVTLGKNVRVISAGDGESFTGKAIDLDEDGALVVETSQGRRTVYAGDVSIR
ncbi:MAG: bifunctional biotin--[Selenomonadaceae bacterium]|nr:bifunctional biotin--[acetyl-CoA-carboxylase] synthetase/biotin operon repressor [Selenomonadaceae bacterium]